MATLESVIWLVNAFLLCGQILIAGSIPSKPTWEKFQKDQGAVGTMLLMLLLLSHRPNFASVMISQNLI